MQLILVGWEPNDTVISELEPTKTWIVIAIESKKEGRWIEIVNTPDCEAIKGTGSMGGYESILVQIGFRAFRK